MAAPLASSRRVVPEEVAIIMCVTSVIGMLIGLSLISSVCVLFAARYWLTGRRGPFGAGGDILIYVYVVAPLEALVSLFSQMAAFDDYPAFNYRSVVGDFLTYVADINDGRTDVPATITFRSAENWCAGYEFKESAGVTIESAGTNVACSSGRFSGPFVNYNSFYEWVHVVSTLSIVISLGNVCWTYYSRRTYMLDASMTESKAASRESLPLLAS